MVGLKAPIWPLRPKASGHSTNCGQKVETTNRDDIYYSVELRAAMCCISRPGDTSRSAEQVLLFKHQEFLSVRRESKQ